MSPHPSNSSCRSHSRRNSSAGRRLRAVLLATSALASVGLTTAAHAQDATWQGDTDGQFNKSSNWAGGNRPLTGGTATFGASGQTSVTSQENESLSALQFMPGSSSYEFTIATGTFALTGGGIVTQPGAGPVKFIVESALQFEGVSNAANATIVNNANARVSFTGTASADHAGITNLAGAALTFVEDSTAANASITNHGSIVFDGGAKAGQASITNNAGAIMLFSGASTADNATITSEGTVLFGQQAKGGTAQMIVNKNGALDISGLETDGTTFGSLAGDGTVRLGGKNLAVGGNKLQTTFAGVIADGGQSSGDHGSLTKEGTGVLTLTGQNTYTGATKVTGGWLFVDGSIEESGGVTVEAGGRLGGTGTVSSTVVNDGGWLVAGGNTTLYGTLKVNGDLSLSKGAQYLVEVSPDAAGSTSVTGTATLGGATVQANFAKGSYVTKQYSILDAGSISGSFGQLVSTNLLPIFSASLSYDDPKHVYLKLSVIDDGNGNGGGSGGGSGGGGGGQGGSDPLAGYNINQRNVVNAFRRSAILAGGELSGMYATLTSTAGLTQVSGETAVGSQQATFDAMGQFMGVMLDPAMAGRGESPRNAMASMPRKAPVVEDFNSRWAVWAAGFGGSQSINGDAVLGSNKTTSSVYGSAVGADYRLSPNTVAGFALAGGGTSFRVANGGSGNSDLFQAGGYLRHTQGAAFIAAALAYGWQDVTTNRTVTAAGFDTLRGRFNANALSGRLEGGYRVAGAIMDVTPYAAGQFISYHLPSYAEQVASGANTFVLAYSGKDVTASRTELGVRTERAFAQDNASLVTLRGRLAWAHDFNTDRNVQAVFVTLPGSAFTVNGAQASANTALTSLSAEIAWRNGWAASATFDGQFSDTTKSYAGKGVVRYAW